MSIQTPQPSGRVLFSQTPEGSQTIYEAPSKLQQAMLSAASNSAEHKSGRIIAGQSVTRPGMVVTGGSSRDGKVLEIRGDVSHEERVHYETLYQAAPLQQQYAGVRPGSLVGDSLTRPGMVVNNSQRGEIIEVRGDASYETRTVYNQAAPQPRFIGAAGAELNKTLTHPGKIIYTGSMHGIDPERMGDATYAREYGFDLISQPAPTRIVNPAPPFGFAGVHYEKGLHVGQASPAPMSVHAATGAAVERVDETQYGTRVMYAPSTEYGYSKTKAAQEGLSTSGNDSFPSVVVSRTFYPERVIHAGIDNPPRDIPIPGFTLPGAARVNQHGSFVEPREEYTTSGGCERRGGNALDGASRLSGWPTTNGMPHARDFSNIPLPAKVPWSEVLYAQMPKERLVGLHVVPTVGLKVALSEQGKAALRDQELGPMLTQGRPGAITSVHPDGDAVMVMWDAVQRFEEGESGWYRIGAYGQYTLVVHWTDNRDEDIAIRADKIKDDGPFSSRIRELGLAGY